jgi:predicted outer membrane protein
MKAECNVNVREIGSIVNEMMADKNKFGREAFKAMTNEAPGGEDPVEAVYRLLTEAQGKLREAAQAFPDEYITKTIMKSIQDIESLLSTIYDEYDSE